MADHADGLQRLRTLRLARAPYVAIGVILAAVKFALDQAVSRTLRDEPWSPWNYLVWPLDTATQSLLDGTAARGFALTMVAVAVPFALIGIALTVARLRDAGLPTMLALLFLLPFANLAVILLACVAPTRAAKADRAAPTIGPANTQTTASAFEPPLWPPAGSAPAAAEAVRDAVHEDRQKRPPRASGIVFVVAAVAGALATLAGCVLAVVIGTFGLAVFFITPAIGGLVAAALVGLDGVGGAGRGLCAALLSLLLCAAGILLLALDGAVCVIMALPLMIPLALVGGLFGLPMQRLLRGARNAEVPRHIVVLAICGPVAASLCATVAESRWRTAAPLRSVETVVIVDAGPESVWSTVVAFPPIAPPTEWLFRIGIAYPIHATIIPRAGESELGPGAIRECVFSTGPFVEPITRWEPPHRLAFDVVAQPAPMRELSPYEIHPDHLDEHLTSRRGEFRLEPIEDGRTRLVGTTWYEVRMWPQAWWGNVSDAIIHRIHRRVLEHVRLTAEGVDRSEP